MVIPGPNCLIATLGRVYSDDYKVKHINSLTSTFSIVCNSATYQNMRSDSVMKREKNVQQN